MGSIRSNGIIFIISIMTLLCSCRKNKYFGDQNLSLADYSELESAVIYDPENSEKYVIDGPTSKKILDLLEGSDEINNRKKLYDCLQFIAGDPSHSDELFIVVFKNNIFSVNGDYYKKKDLDVLSAIHSILDEYRKSKDVQLLPIE